MIISFRVIERNVLGRRQKNFDCHVVEILVFQAGLKAVMQNCNDDGLFCNKVRSSTRVDYWYADL